jgi:hypothetical protein
MWDPYRWRHAVTQLNVETGEVSITESHHLSLRRWRWWIAAATAVVAVAAEGTYWLLTPDTIGGYGNETGGTVRVGTTLYIGQMVKATSGRATEVTLDAVKPRVITNTADADVRVLVCTIGTGLIGATDRTSPYCSTARPFHGGHLELGYSPGEEDILLAITPHQAGIVRVDGVHVRYRDGLRLGSAHTGIQVDTTTPSR